MRRSDREIKDFDEIVDVLRRADVIRLGLHDSKAPYVVPLSFGFEVKDGKIIIYVHGAKEGYKHDLLARDNHVCVEADIFHGYKKYQDGVTACYESVIGYGDAAVIEGDEAERGMDLLLEHCGFPGLEYDKAVHEIMRCYKIVLSEVTGKRRFVS
ncbi:MAG: pyridoxamine 5'-phosphate oxidase family protein [Clostridiales bacterium]|jgi:nitroimidazol reductase NimA-like FMN-containing flavoprotein (pyridoxamine 5'-phosphate oxidase superfamily)|nr:pyridoxamine 5'-phosphate oxidase family protein [Clostridiales bacterium]